MDSLGYFFKHSQDDQNMPRLSSTCDWPTFICAGRTILIRRRSTVSNISQWLVAVSLPSCRCGLWFDYTATAPLPGSNWTWTSSLFPVCNFRWTGGSVSHRHGLTLQPQICHHCACRFPSSFAYHSLISHNSACKDWHVSLSIEDFMLVVRWLWQFFFSNLVALQVLSFRIWYLNYISMNIQPYSDIIQIN